MRIQLEFMHIRLGGDNEYDEFKFPAAITDAGLSEKVAQNSVDCLFVGKMSKVV